MIEKICVVYSHHKLGDLIWQLPYMKAISEHHNKEIDLVVREKTQAKEILKDLNYINTIHYNNFRKKFFYWIDVFKLKKVFSSEGYTHVWAVGLHREAAGGRGGGRLRDGTRRRGRRGSPAPAIH